MFEYHLDVFADFEYPPKKKNDPFSKHARQELIKTTTPIGSVSKSYHACYRSCTITFPRGLYPRTLKIQKMRNAPTAISAFTTRRPTPNRIFNFE
jgi:hypothetical protein